MRCQKLLVIDIAIVITSRKDLKGQKKNHAKPVINNNYKRKRIVKSGNKYVNSN